jgi:hypothetical protein
MLLKAVNFYVGLETSYSGDYKKKYTLKCDAVQSGRYLTAFRKNYFRLQRRASSKQSESCWLLTLQYIPPKRL